MSTIDVYGTRREAEVMQETWGHLAPEPGKTYTGTVVFTNGCFRDLTVITCEFADLPDSPWFYDTLHNWLLDQEPEEGKVYRFTGTYRVDRDDPFIGVTWVLPLDAVPGEPVNR